MSEPGDPKRIKHNIRMIEDAALELADDVEREEWSQGLMALDDLVAYAGELIQDLETKP